MFPMWDADMIETLTLAALLMVGMRLVRTYHRALRSVWGEARWYERCVLLLAMVPIPGPFDEIAGLLIVRRIIARRTR